MTNSITSPAHEYADALDAVRDVRAAASGQRAVKQGKTRYLPHPNASDANSNDARTRELAALRYQQYIQRAVYTNYTGQTQVTMLGMAFRTMPAISLPNALEYAIEDMDGGGQGVNQLAMMTVNELMLGGVAGLLVDYPRVDQPISKEEQTDMGIRAFCRVYPMESIIRFRTRRIGGRTVVSTVVLQERKQTDNDLVDEEELQYRVLTLEGGVYTHAVHDADGQLQDGWPVQPRASGKTLSEIPFFLAGAVLNNVGYQEPILADIAALNLAHYRDSADMQEGMHIAGQPTLVLTSDLSIDQWNEANPSGVQIGSTRGLFLGANGSAQLLQAQANSGLKEAMSDKESAMRQIGARLIESKSSNQTAEAARIDAGVSSASLMTVVENTEKALEAALRWMCDFMAADKGEVELKMNREFSAMALSAGDVAALAQANGLGLIAKSDAQNRLRAAGWIDPARTNEDIDAEIAEAGDGLTP